MSTPIYQTTLRVVCEPDEAESAVRFVMWTFNRGGMRYRTPLTDARHYSVETTGGPEPEERDITVKARRPLTPQEVEMIAWVLTGDPNYATQMQSEAISGRS